MDVNNVFLVREIIAKLKFYWLDGVTTRTNAAAVVFHNRELYNCP